jgi:hypothetical protein
MTFGGSIMSFALPLGAFIVISIVLYYLFRARHTGPKLKYLATASITSIATREPGPVPAPPVSAAAPETAAPETAAPEAAAEPGTTAEPDTTAESESEK